MKAEEMFKELGFKKEIDCLGIVRYDKPTNDTDKEIIVFYSDEMEYSAHFVYKSKGMMPLDITKDLHKAINQQLKELGW